VVATTGVMDQPKEKQLRVKEGQVWLHIKEEKQQQL